MKNELIIIGYSGHSYVVCDILLNCKINIVGYCDISKKELNPFDLSYLGRESDYDFKNVDVFIAIGDNKLRKTIFNDLERKASFGDAFHPSSQIGSMTQLGTMNMLGANSVINPLSAIGNGVIINTGAIIEHDCKIGNFVHIAPGAIVLGNVIVGDNTFLGARSVVKQGISICNDVIIGAGAVVVSDITIPGTYVGVPAIKL